MLRTLLPLTLFLLGSGPLAPSAMAQPDPTTPNVLVVLLDDWGVDRFNAYGPTTSRTPVLDYIAGVSLRFERAYSDPVCSPTRAAALTGRLGTRTGVMTGFPWVNTTPGQIVLDPAMVDTLPELLDPHGYQTAVIGKWHLTGTNWLPDPYMHPIDFGFDMHKGPISNIIVGVDTYHDYEYNFATPLGALQSRDTTYATTRQVDDALGWIDRHETRPWFLWLALNAPHKPWDLPPQELVSVDLATVLTPQDEYDAVLEAADTEIGRLLASLRPAVLQNTVVLILGDNGTPKSAFNGPVLAKKGSVAQGGIHVPLLAWHAGVRPGVVSELMHVVDLHATILELVGAPPQAPTDSVSFAPLLHGAVAGDRDWVYASHHGPIGFGPFVKDSSAAVDKNWKLRDEGGFRMLYRLGPGESETTVFPPFSALENAALSKLNAVMNGLEP